MPSSPLTEASAFACDCDNSARPACKGLPFYKKHEDKRYCVLHYPDKDKRAAFSEAMKNKLEADDFDFRGVWFPDEVKFNDFTFTKPAIFNSARFSERADFSRAKFNAKAFFRNAIFLGTVSFRHSNFTEDAFFISARFSAMTSFSYATFCAAAHFTDAAFTGRVSFSPTTFKDYARFQGATHSSIFGDKSSISFQFARIEKPERLLFHSITLRPHWFVNLDTRKLEFTNVNWDWNNITAKQEIENLQAANVISAHGLLATACRNLAVNAEENHRYEEASRFRYMAMEARRLENLFGFAPWTLGWWYWLASGYGERVWRAFVVLIGVWLLAAALYTQVGFVRWESRVSSESEVAAAKRDEVGAPLRWQRALTYSLGVMTLQKPEPRPATNAAQALVMLETIFGPVQAALLALAIRRKFMR